MTLLRPSTSTRTAKLLRRKQPAARNERRRKALTCPIFPWLQICSRSPAGPPPRLVEQVEERPREAHRPGRPGYRSSRNSGQPPTQGVAAACLPVEAPDVVQPEAPGAVSAEQAQNLEVLPVEILARDGVEVDAALHPAVEPLSRRRLEAAMGAPIVVAGVARPPAIHRVGAMEVLLHAVEAALGRQVIVAGQRVMEDLDILDVKPGRALRRGEPNAVHAPREVLGPVVDVAQGPGHLEAEAQIG